MKAKDTPANGVHGGTRNERNLPPANVRIRQGCAPFLPNSELQTEASDASFRRKTTEE
jgi:hypothetical protein